MSSLYDDIKKVRDQYNAYLRDSKDFNDLKRCCDDLIDHIQNPNVNDNSYENWKMPE